MKDGIDIDIAREGLVGLLASEQEQEEERDQIVPLLITPFGSTWVQLT